MKTAAETYGADYARERTRFADFWALSKPELSLLSVLTAFAGFYIAARGEVSYGLLAATIAGTALLAAAAAAMNMYLERHYDAQMRRTQRRPIPAGRIAPAEALAFGIIGGAAGAAILAVAVNPLTAALGVLTYTTYLFVYTPLKRRTTWNTLVGCIPGAIPPMMGWAAARNAIGTEAWALFAILFLWQMPHFLSLAWMYRADYKRAGFKMLPAAEARGAKTSFQILLFCAMLIPASAIPAYMKISGEAYFYASILLGTAFLALGVSLAFRRTNANARRVFAASLIYLPALFIVMMADKL